MIEHEIINDILYLVVDTDEEVLDFFQSSEATKIMDNYPRIKCEIVYRDEVY